MTTNSGKNGNISSTKRFNILSDFIYGDHATEETFAKALESLGYGVVRNELHPTIPTLVVHIKHTWKLPNPGLRVPPVFGGPPRVLYHPDSTIEYNTALFDHYDFVFLAHNSPMVDNKKVFYMPLAYDSKLKHFPKKSKKRMATFIGTWYPEREFLRSVPNLNCYGNGWSAYINGNDLKWTFESASKIGVNHVRPDTTDNNIRMYELAALGTFQLTNKCNEDFEPGKDLVLYSDPKDLEEKIAYYLEHDKKREIIAEHGQETGRKFTFEYRVKQILKIIGVKE